MADETFVQHLKEKAEDLRTRLKHIEGLLKLYGEQENDLFSSADTKNEFTPEIPTQGKKSTTLTSKTKNGIKELANYPLSYKKSDLKHNLKKMGINVTSATLNTALRSLREDNIVIGYRINRSNQNVYYMSTDGIDKGNNGYPVKEDYRPKAIEAEDVNEFEFLD